MNVQGTCSVTKLRGQKGKRPVQILEKVKSFLQVEETKFYFLKHFKTNQLPTIRHRCHFLILIVGLDL